jgi:hypothetical protein
MLRRVALVRTDVSEENVTSIIRAKKICKLRKAFLCSVLQLLVTANVIPRSLILLTLMMEAIVSSDMFVLIRATWGRIQEDGILQN